VKPYYEDGSVTIYHGDCRELMEEGIGSPFEVDMLLTDPPYGINLQTNYSKLSGSTKNYKPVEGDAVPFDPAPLLAYRKAVLWGANHYHLRLPEGGGWLVWDKREGSGSNMFADAEVAWCSFKTPIRLYSHLWGVNRRSEKNRWLHPTQKPVALMRWVLEKWTEPGQMIFDPYMGSGPVAEACRDLDRRYIGIEMEEEYCEVAAQRFDQGVLDLAA
jgi:site-specific DNA-methyltransferase (adenine-specific)